MAGILAVGVALGSIERANTVHAQDLGAGGSQPNFIVVMVDDQSMHTFDRKTMPHTFALRNGRQGRELLGHASPPLCCPSRAGFITGQYPQNHGVVRNKWELLDEPDNTLGSWLQNASYRTGMVGKYLNAYTPFPQPAAGWDRWFQLGGRAGYYDYSVSDQATVIPYGHERSEYSTTVITKESRRFISGAAEAGEPFFLWTSYYAPHNHRADQRDCGSGSPQPLTQDFRQFKNSPVELSPSFNEHDVSDKPDRVRMPGIGSLRSDIKERIRCTRATLQEVDRRVLRMQETLRQEGLEDDTVIVYVSDNGYFFGEHRIVAGKERPYVEAVRVPLIVRVPPKFLGGDEVAKVTQPIANIDLAPTILDLADADPSPREETAE